MGDIDVASMEYIACGVADGHSLLPFDDFMHFVLPILEDACGGDQDKAVELSHTLHDALARFFPSALGTDEHQKPATSNQGATTLESFGLVPNCTAHMPYVSLRENRAQDKLRGCGQGAQTPSNLRAAGCSDGNRRSSLKKPHRMRKAAQLLETDAATLNTEVLVAEENAVMTRPRKGCNLKQAIKFGPFDLPHPGGLGNLLENASFTLAPGHRYALVGRNGKGKSTLLRSIAARRIGGLPAAVQVHYVSQDASCSQDAMALTPVDVVLEADPERRALVKKAKALESASTADEIEELCSCLCELEANDAESVPFRARRLLTNLGFSADLLKRQMRDLSGGWRVRVALAAAIFAKPDLLFLDEPTNHLSMEAVLWLMHELNSSPVWASRAVVIVSHDRYFISETCTDTLHISGVARRLTQTQCSFSTWARFRAEQQKAHEHRSKVRADDIAKCKAYIASGAGARGSTASSSRWRRVQRLQRDADEEVESLAALQEDVDYPFEIMSAGQLDGPAVMLNNVSFSYPGAGPLFTGLGNSTHEITIDTTSRLVLLGGNGNGKTTLLKIMLGELHPNDGEVVINRHARLAFVNQHHTDQIDLARSPFDFLRDSVPGNRSDSWCKYLREELIKNGIDSSLLDVPAAALSGGLRTRLAMIAVSIMKPHVLFMDEPTNNLDEAGVEALADAIENFEGGVVVVSHDHYFVSRIATKVWAVDGGEVKPCETGFEEYLAKMLCKIDPTSSVAADAVSAYAKKKRTSEAYIVGGQASRQAFEKELAELRNRSSR